MKTAKFTLMFLACAATGSAVAQNALPQCGSANFDQAQNVFTIVNPATGAVNQQCLITVLPRGAVPDPQFPAPYFVEGRYTIELSGGGGGGSGGASRDKGGGGGGAGAAPAQVVKYLAPGVYKLTIGTGGYGGSADGGRTGHGNPTSLTNFNTGQLIFGFQGADVWTPGSQAAGDGRGGQAVAGGSRGGSGGDSGPGAEEPAQSGGELQTGGYSGRPGQAGSDNGRSGQANAGGGGGAGVGDGGAGQSENSDVAAGIGTLGAGGGGGRGGRNTAAAGGQGGHGFIRLAQSEPAPQAIAPATGAVGQAPAIERATESVSTPPSAVARPARMDRN